MEPSDVQKRYDSLAKQYGLPDFKTVNEEFEIDKIERDSSCFLRVVRKVMMDKIVNAMGFFEMVLNPANAPRFYLAPIQGLTIEHRKLIEQLYSKLSDLSLQSMINELDYNEKEEVAQIKQVVKVWADVKPDFRILLSAMSKPSKPEVKKDRNYFG